MRVLSLSDQIVPFLYSPQVRRRFNGVDLVIGCGDLAYYYLEYVLNALDTPLFFVRGNHDKIVEYSVEGQRTAPHGGVDLHRRTYNHKGLLMAGVEGSLRYRPGPYQYTQQNMWAHVFTLLPGLFANRLVHGRFLDVLITHSPPVGIHDAADLPHQGIKAFRWLISVFQPSYYFHGHIHIYRPDTITETRLGRTQVINTFGYRETVIDHEMPRTF
ncbi:MAG: metallophosphoesterase family protein [Anaerolineales bacterium]|nr:metallophosphoesterase family protein [Anaerolineales bacterium]